jgi:hypothetical protein
MQPQNLLDDEPIDLARYDEAFARAMNTARESDSSSGVPDGFYEVTVEDAWLSKTTTTRNPMIIWKLRITGPTHEGATLTKVRVITEKTVAFVGQDFQRLGIPLERISDVHQRLAGSVGRSTGVFKRAGRDGWNDIFFCRAEVPRRGPASEDGIWPANAAAAVGTDDDLPF